MLSTESPLSGLSGPELLGPGAQGPGQAGAPAHGEYQAASQP